MKAIRKHLRDFVAITLLAALSVGVAYYIVQHQGLRIPFIEAEPFKVRFELETAQAVTPGQGQTIRVSGIRIGDIGEIELKNGRAIVTGELDEQYEGLIRRDATAFLRPKTGLKDMFIEVQPGSKSEPALEENELVPIRSTLPDVNPDEFLAGLDLDTREYLVLLLNGARTGLKGRSDDLRETLKRFEPTYRDLAAVSEASASRRVELRRLVNSLQRLNTALAEKDDDLAELILNASQVFRALASERDNVAGTLRELAPTLTETRVALGKVETMADLLGPTATKLRPVLRSLTEANTFVTPFAREAAPLLRDDIRPFVREARPFVRTLRPTAADLVEAEPFITRSVVVLNHLFNMLGFNQNGREAPGATGRDEGYLFYLAWLAHQSNNLFSNQDAHGPFRPLTLGGTCATLRSLVSVNPSAEFGLGLTGVLTDPRLCGGPLDLIPGAGFLPLPKLPRSEKNGDDAKPAPEERTPADEETP
jgi:phospholipid/cholesterol/gamma-HCH transport system substrate-binding protein